MILGENGEKMSKSRGNVVNPDDIIRDFGADTMRLYEMFIGDFEQSAPWNTQSIKGCKRFLERIAGLTDIATGTGATPKLESAFHKTIKKVSQDIEEMKFNTAIAAMMSLVNDIYNVGTLTVDELKSLIKLLNPFAPHITEEIWHVLGENTLLSVEAWPTYDEAKTVDASVTIAVQICGKMRGTIDVPAGAEEDVAFDLIMKDEKLASFFEGKTIVKKIYVKNKILNIIAK